MKRKSSKKSHKDITKSWFGNWSNEYDNSLGKMSFHAELLKLVVKHAFLEENDEVLDIGCGTGLLSLKLLQKANCKITAIDNSKEMTAIFKNKIKLLKLGSRIKCRSMDADVLNFQQNSFDKIVSSVTLHHVKNKLKLIKFIYRILRPGGVFVIGEIDMDTTGKHSDIKRFKRILRVLEAEWICAMKDVGIEAFVRMYDNGKKHIFNEGEYCLSLKQWASFCRKAGFGPVTIKRVPRYKAFGIVVARKT